MFVPVLQLCPVKDTPPTSPRKKESSRGALPVMRPPGLPTTGEAKTPPPSPPASPVQPKKEATEDLF